MIKQLTDRPLVMERGMNIKEAVGIACGQPTLLDALVYIAIWDTEHTVVQVKRHFETGETTPEGAGWETCFRTCFEAVFEEWQKKHPPDLRYWLPKRQTVTQQDDNRPRYCSLCNKKLADFERGTWCQWCKAGIPG